MSLLPNILHSKTRREQNKNSVIDYYYINRRILSVCDGSDSRRRNTFFFCKRGDLFICINLIFCRRFSVHETDNYVHDALMCGIYIIHKSPRLVGTYEFTANCKTLVNRVTWNSKDFCERKIIFRPVSGHKNLRKSIWSWVLPETISRLSSGNLFPDFGIPNKNCLCTGGAIFEWRNDYYFYCILFIIYESEYRVRISITQKTQYNVYFDRHCIVSESLWFFADCKKTVIFFAEFDDFISIEFQFQNQNRVFIEVQPQEIVHAVCKAHTSYQPIMFDCEYARYTCEMKQCPDSEETKSFLFSHLNVVKGFLM